MPWYLWASHILAAVAGFAIRAFYDSFRDDKEVPRC